MNHQNRRFRRKDFQPHGYGRNRAVRDECRELRDVPVLLMQPGHGAVVLHAQIEIASVRVGKGDDGIHQIGIAQLLHVTFEFDFHGLPLRYQIRHGSSPLFDSIILHACNSVNRELHG